MNADCRLPIADLSGAKLSAQIVRVPASAGMPELTMERWSLALVFRELNYLYELELMREWSALLPEGAL